MGSQRLEVETAFTRNFRPDSQIVRQYQFVEDRFAGAGVWDLLIPMPAPPGGAADGAEAKGELPPPPTAALVQALAMEQELLDSVPLLAKAISIADAFRAALGPLDRLGFMARAALNAAWNKMRSEMPEFIDSIYNVDPQDGRAWIHVLLRAPEQLGAEEKSRLIRRVQSIATQHFEDAEVTGYYVLLANLIESLLADQWLTFGVSAGVVAAMMAAAFRSVALSIATMVPNIVPVLVLFGAMGWLGLEINMGAAMIAAVSVGLSVDGSIHYVMLYQRLRSEGAALHEALARAQDTVGRAATYATLALVVGFATLVVSDFIPTMYFGGLVSLAMIGGLVGNLLVLPGLIRLIDRRDYQKAG
jgi:predicted RND superfamily exporter protein